MRHNIKNMPLTSGTLLGPCEIQSAIGAGGMGEVYKARDTRLNRIQRYRLDLEDRLEVMWRGPL